MSGHDIDFVDLDFTWPSDGRCPRHQAVAQLLGHCLHVRAGQTKFRGDLPVRKLQPHQVEAQHPHTQRLMVPGQHGAAEIVEAAVTHLAEITLPVRLRRVMAIADDRGAVATRAAHTVWPPVLTQQFEASRLIQQRRKVDQFRDSHDKKLVSVIQGVFHPSDQTPSTVATLKPDNSHPEMVEGGDIRRRNRNGQ
jgi:hypothetical protein